MRDLESDLESKLKKYCDNCGYKLFKIKCEGETGFPDRMLFMPNGIIIIFELKRNKKSIVSHKQRKIINTLRDDFGANTYIVYDFYDFKCIVENHIIDISSDKSQGINREKTKI